MLAPDQHAWQELLFTICRNAAGWILKGATFAELRARLVPEANRLLDRFDIPAQMRAPGLVEAMSTMLGMEIWNATPLPDNRFRPRKLVKPERNAPCPCGSGRKYKQCCAEAPPFDMGISEELMLAAVLDLLPAKQLAEAPLIELHPEALALVAGRWLDDGKEKKAIALLERYFTHMANLDGRSEFAADSLLNAYLETNAVRKKQKFVDQLKAAPDKDLRSCGWQRQATMCSDMGDFPGAWEAFREAQRNAPNAPALSHLEVLLLLSEGRDGEARARADFWITRLQRDTKCDHDDLIQSLRNMTSGDEGKLRMTQFARGPLRMLAELVATWPEPACEYRLVGGTELEAKAPLAGLESRWMDLREGSEFDELILFAAEHAMAAQSFMIVRDLSEIALTLEGGVPGSGEALSRRILDHGESLRKAVLGKLKALARELPWGFLNNRPMLTLVAHYVEAFRETRRDVCLDLMRWSVTVASPVDNTGLRETLIHDLVAAGRAQEAIDVAAAYPDDFASTEYGRVLAYFAAGKPEVAEVALRKAVERSPKVWKMLHAANPKRPRSKNPGYITLGGDDEAWEYRENHLDLWRSTGALRWSLGIRVPATGKVKVPPSVPDGQGKLL